MSRRVTLLADQPTRSQKNGRNHIPPINRHLQRTQHHTRNRAVLLPRICIKDPHRRCIPLRGIHGPNVCSSASTKMAHQTNTKRTNQSKRRNRKRTAPTTPTTNDQIHLPRGSTLIPHTDARMGSFQGGCPSLFRLTNRCLLSD